MVGHQIWLLLILESKMFKNDCVTYLLTHCHSHALQLAVGDNIIAIKTMRAIDAVFEWNKHSMV